MPKHSTDQSRDNLRRQVSYRVPDAEAQALLRDFRQRFLDLAVAIDDLLPASREKSLVLTNLDQARMWACSAAVAGGEIREELTINIPARQHLTRAARAEIPLSSPLLDAGVRYQLCPPAPTGRRGIRKERCMNLSEMSVRSLCEHFAREMYNGGDVDIHVAELERRMRPVEGCVRLPDGRDVRLDLTGFNCEHPDTPVPPPLCGDGVLWMMNEDYYTIADGEVHEFFVFDNHISWTSSGWVVRWGEGEVQLVQCYSTREAAEAARKANA